MNVDLTNKFSPFQPVIRVEAVELPFAPEIPTISVNTPDQPVLAQMPGSDDKWVMVFSTVDDLRAAMDRLGIEMYKIKQITDGNEFVASILDASNVRVMLDPRVVGEKTRWTEVKFDE